jgi:hypothetical protein
MSDNKKGVGGTDTPAADPSEGLKLPYGTDSAWETDNRVYASGEWHERHDNWRDQVDLSTADRMTVYAAGRHDGHQQAMTEFMDMWKLFRSFYEFVGKAAKE